MLDAIVKCLKGFWSRFKEYIALASGIITVATFLFKWEIDKWFQYLLIILIIAYAIFEFRYIIKNIFDAKRAEAELEQVNYNRNVNLSQAMHSYFHNLRHIISSMEETQIKKYADVREPSKNLCDYLSEFYRALFKSYLGENNVSVCIKVVIPENIVDNDYNTWQMETLARSVTTIQKRVGTDRDVVSIKDNSDFQIILSHEFQDELFSFANMENIEEDFKKTYRRDYKNSRGKDFLEYYKSTIVVPIKIDGRYASKRLLPFIPNLEDIDLILGFLCIDSMKTFDTKAEQRIFAVGVEYAKSLADSLYMLFEKIIICYFENAGKDRQEDIMQERGTDKKRENGEYKLKKRIEKNIRKTRNKK